MSWSLASPNLTRMARKGPKPILDLARYVPESRDQEIMLELAMRVCGTGPVRAANCVAALVRLRDTGQDGLSSPVRSYYRQELAKMGPAPWEPGGAGLAAKIRITHSYRRFGAREPAARPDRRSAAADVEPHGLAA